MIGLDTNVLARYYISAIDSDEPATAKQCEAARLLMDSGKRLMVSQSVVLELEWLLRGAYKVSRTDIQKIFSHLLSLGHIDIQDRVALQSAVSALALGFDFSDALHHGAYRACSSVATFDDKGFVRRAKKVALKPTVTLLQ